MVVLNRVLVVATGRGGAVGEPVSVYTEADVRRVLVGGDLAHMALSALRAGADRALCVRVNDASAATCDLGDLHLTAKNPGQIGDAVLVRRYAEPSGKVALELRNPVTGEHERYGALPSLAATMRALSGSRVATAETRPKARILTDWTFFDGGSEGEADWESALELADNMDAHSAVLGSGEPEIVTRAERTLPAPLYVGAGVHMTKGPLLNATYKIADAAQSARVVCNSVIDRDMQTHRDVTMPAYYLAAYAAGLYAKGERGTGLEVNFPKLGYIFSEDDVAAMTARNIIPAPYDHLTERYLLAHL